MVEPRGFVDAFNDYHMGQKRRKIRFSFGIISASKMQKIPLRPLSQKPRKPTAGRFVEEIFPIAVPQSVRVSHDGWCWWTEFVQRPSIESLGKIAVLLLRKKGYSLPRVIASDVKRMCCMVIVTSDVEAKRLGFVLI